MDKTVVIQYTNSLEDLEKQKDEYNRLTYREKKFSDMEQMKLTGLYNNDIYNIIKNSLSIQDKIEVPIHDETLEESIDLENMYNKSKYNTRIIEKQIDKCFKKLEKNPDDIDTKNRLEYLQTIKIINMNDNTHIDRIYIYQVNTLCKMKLSKKEKIKSIDIFLKDISKTIMNYDIAISYMSDENKVEEGIKKATELICTNALGTIIGPAFTILNFCVQRNNTKLAIKLKQSTKPKEDLIKEKDKLENTKKLIELKRKQIEEE